LQSGSALLQRPALHCQQQRSRHAAAAAAGEGDRDYSQEEADAYAEILRQRSKWNQTADQFCSYTRSARATKTSVGPAHSIASVDALISSVRMH
jgi:hypothetical protein